MLCLLRLVWYEKPRVNDISAGKGIRSAICFEKLIDLLFGKNHCKISYEHESKTIIH